MNLKTKINLIVATAVVLIIGVAISPSIDPDWVTVIALGSVGIMTLTLANDPIITGK